MSVKMMSMVFERYPNGGGERVLALALADHADDGGGKIWPSVELLAKKTLQSERTVQYQLRKMVLMGWLIKVSDGGFGRRSTTEYQISDDWVKGAEIAPLEKINTPESLNLRVQPEVVKGAIAVASKGAIAVAPESSITIIEPSCREQVAAQAAPIKNLQLKKPIQQKLIPEKPKIFFDDAENKLCIPLEFYDPWETVFPSLDLDAEIGKAELWLIANPRKRKKQYEKFLFGWFSRAAESAKPRLFAKAALTQGARR